MPKLTNKCAICGKPILKSMTICAKCASDKEARQREIDSQMEVYNVRLQSAFLWEKRRYEIAKDCYYRMIDETRADEPLTWTMHIYDEKTGTCPLHESKDDNQISDDL